MSKNKISWKNKTKTYIFKIVIEEDPFEDGKMAYHAYCPSLKGCHSWGYTKEEALKNIREAIQCHLEAMIKNKELVSFKELELRDSFVISSPNVVAITI